MAKQRYAKQWQRVKDNRELLKNAKDFPVLESLERVWGVIEGEQSVVKREDADRARADSPLSSVMYHIDSGFYPPPELMLALVDAWSEYQQAAGRRTLEECFLDSPKRKVGNDASQHKTKITNAYLFFTMQTLIKEGATQIAAAESVAADLNMDVETVARMYRRHIKP